MTDAICVCVMCVFFSYLYCEILTCGHKLMGLNKFINTNGICKACETITWIYKEFIHTSVTR